MVYRHLRILSDSGKVSQVQKVDGKTVRVEYRLTSAPPTVDLARVRLILEKIEARNQKVRDEALMDLRSLSRNARLPNRETFERLISIARKNRDAILLEALAYQAVQAQKVQDTTTLKLLGTFQPVASAIVRDIGAEAEAREQALRILQLTADFDTLSDLAVKVTGTAGDNAQSPSKPSQFGIVIQSICVNAARFPEYRSKIYDLLLSSDPDVVTRAQKILGLSREP